MMRRCLSKTSVEKKETSPGFYFDFITDDHKILCGVFWADATCRKHTVFFGDMVSAETTYGSNKYDMKFVPITGVDNHKRCVILGAGLISNEDVESYKWLFNAYLELTNNHHPKVIITDQDASMKLAIPSIFPNTTHRLCMWHIMKKLREKV